MRCLFSGCDGGSDGSNGLYDISYQNASLFREDNQLYEKLQNSGRAEFTAGHQVATDKIRFKIYDVMRYYDRHDVLKNEMNNFMTDSGPNHIFFAWCHSNHPRSGVNEFMKYFQNRGGMNLHQYYQHMIETANANESTTDADASTPTMMRQSMMQQQHHQQLMQQQHKSAMMRQRMMQQQLQPQTMQQQMLQPQQQPGLEVVGGGTFFFA